MADLETTKEDKFEYRTPDDLYVHAEPFSPKVWNERLRKIMGDCPLGEPRLRIVWGGDMKKRGYVQTEKGSVEKMVIKYPAPISKIRKIKGFVYFNDKGQRVFVTKPEDIPQGKLAVPEIEEFELGKLRWVLEKKFTPEELVAMSFYPPPNTPQAKMFGVNGGRKYKAYMDSRGEYIGVYPLETPDGKYFEPDNKWFEMLEEQVYQWKNASEAEKDAFLVKSAENEEKREQMDKAYEKEQREIIWEDSLIEAEKAPQGQIYLT